MQWTIDVGHDKQSLTAFTMDQVEHSAARQRRIIRAAATLVAAGGRLVYSTCTFAVAENEAIIEHFLDEHSDWSLMDLPQFQSWASPRLPGCYRLWPHLNSCDGTFAAVLQRSSESPEDTAYSARSNRPRNRKDVRQASIDVTNLDFLTRDAGGRYANMSEDSTNLDARDSHQLWQFGDQLHLLRNSSVGGLASVITGAVPIAQSFASRVEPLYGSAVINVEGIRPTQSIELNNDQAMAFIRGESISSPQSSLQPGWCQVLWNGWPLAWGKFAGNSLKNHLPKLLRNPSIGAV
ncbi:MAG: hypothetical protein U0930_23890 [Pirellulales bacterium]